MELRLIRNTLSGMFRLSVILLIVSLAGCISRHETLYELPPAEITATAMPADLSGSWERDYSRGVDASRTLQVMLRNLGPTLQDRNYPGQSDTGLSRRQIEKLVELARVLGE